MTFIQVVVRMKLEFQYISNLEIERWSASGLTLEGQKLSPKCFAKND